MNAKALTEYQKNIEAYIERLMQESTPDKPLWNIEALTSGAKVKWHYVDGCMMNAFLELYKITGDKRYFEFADAFIDYYVSDDGAMLGYEKDKYELDSIAEGRVLFPLFDETKKVKYQKAIGILLEQVNDQPRTSDGVYWHKKIYPNQVWMDGLYMVQPFRALYAKSLEDNQQKNDIYEDIVHQLKMVREHQFSKEKGLYFHAYDASREAFWADKETGHSANFWLRALGWYIVALVDLYEIMLGDAPKALTDTIQNLYRELVKSIVRYKDEKTDLYMQVVDLPCGIVGAKNNKLNYTETSGSAMIAYAMLKGARLGMLGLSKHHFVEEGKKTFIGLCRDKLSFTEEKGVKTLNLSDICLMAGVGPADKPHRDGSLEYYLSEPIVKNDAKGVAPFLLCYTEIKRLFAF